MKDTNGKRLLILGGTPLTLNILETAKSMGVYTIVMDMNAESPAKKYSDESYDVSTANVNDVIDVFYKSQADGIFTSYEDFNTGIVAEVCERLKIPFYATLAQIDATRDKVSFKKLCREHGIKTVTEYTLNENFNSEDLSKISYPVIIKPADSYAARGITVCQNEDELKKSYQNAVSFSRTNRVIVEDFLKGDYLSITFSVIGGHLNLSAMNDKAINVEQEHIVPLPAAYIFPSKYIDLCLEQVYPNLQKMINTIGIENGTFSIEALVCNNIIYVFEMSFRIGGVNDWKFVLLENHINHMEMYIRLALGLGFSGYDLKQKENPEFSNCYGLMNVLVETGTISKIEGMDEVLNMPQVFRVSQNYEVGDTISWPGTLRQIFSKIFIKTTNKQELLTIFNNINNTIKVLDNNEKNLIMKEANWEDLCE